MNIEPFFDLTITTAADKPELHYDIELRSKINLKKFGLHVYAADPSTEVLCLSFAIGNGPMQRWFPGDPVPPVWFEAANNPNWTAFAHNAQFEITIGKLILRPRHGFPIIPRRATSLHPGGEPRARIAGQARTAGRRDGVQAPQGQGGRTPDARDDQAAQTKEGRRSQRHLLGRGRQWRQNSPPQRLQLRRTSRSSAKRMVASAACRTTSRRCGCSRT